MGAKWTTQQKEAIDARGSDILVSAAAGSGKTAVLVERIIQRITAEEDPLDIDRLLVVTFTKAAAAEMSQRIGAAITKKLEEKPDDVHLQNQLTYLSRADIKTIHAFCLQVIREYYDRLDIDPAVKTADPAEIALLQKDVLGELFETLYEAEDEGFLRLLETYGENTGDQRLKDLILQVYKFSQGYPDPEKLLKKMAEQFYMAEGDTIDQCAWMPLIGEGITNGVDYALYNLQKAYDRICGNGEFTAYGERLEAELEGVKALRQALEHPSYADWHQAYVAVDFARMPAYRGKDKDTAEWVKNLRNEAKASIGKLGETYFCYSAETQTKLISSLYPIAKALSETVIRFAEAFAQAKKEKLWLDFNDYEHFALQILTEPGSAKDNIIPTDAAKQMQQKYDEIMIDEYQDSNVVQEMLLTAVSGAYEGNNNRFMVGDVKQSIYRFRLAMPQLFNEKYRTYPVEKGGKTRKIILSKNFRSRKNVLDGINFIFRQTMSEAFGDVDYNAEAALYDGADFPDFDGLCGGENEMMLLDLSSEETEEQLTDLEELDKRQMEATMIAGKIREMMKAGYQVYDRGLESYRPMEYRDVAVLVRSIRSWGTTLDDIFGKEGIPYYAETAEGYFDVPEIDTVLNFLRLIDNPYQDIPLLSVLHSPLYGISADALTEIRLFGGDGLFYECVLRYLAEGAEEEILEKLERFQADLQDWREIAKELSLCELLRYLYQQTGYYDYAGMTPGGSLRQANLRLLLEKAETYENNSGKGLFHFIRFVEDMKTAETESSAAKLQSEADDLVRVMTIHKSKGLEFPVVFVADLGKQFNEADTRAAVITHQEWGYGMDYMDLDHRASYRTLSKTALAEAIRQENLSEEMRVLYVALTRAKEKLILTGTVRNLQKSVEKWAETADSVEELLPVFRLRRGRSYLDWIMPALLRHPQARVLPEPWEPTDRGEARQFLDEPSKWKFTFLEKGDIYGAEQEKQELAEEQQNVFENWDAEPDYSGRKEEIFRILSWKYDHETATMLPTKVSISEIKRRYHAEISGEEAQVPQELQIPQFGQKKEGLTAAEIGTAMHTVMEAADLRKAYDADALEELLTELQQQGRLTEEEKAAIRRKELLTFFSSDLAKRMQKVDEIHKEQPFAMLVEPKEVFLDDIYHDMEEFIQINGIIDCYFIEENGVVLVDYKSDRLWQEDAFREKYNIQLRLYKEALERVTELPVKACYIYAFAPGKIIPMNFE